jgi:tripartite-type tricarboxylate transporter receptor subunit TctC
MKRKHALLLLALATTVPAAQAQTDKWPDKPVRVIVPMLAGGTSDVLARTFTTRLAEEYGQPFVVDNRGGAGGSIGAGIAAHARPDGYTIIYVPSSYPATAALYKLPYDPVKGIAPISMILILPFILVVSPSVKAVNLKEFIGLSRAQPGALNFGSSGTGGSTHLAGELFQQMTGIKWVYVPYKGDPAVVADLVAGQIQVAFVTAVLADSQIKAGRLRGLAVTTKQRSRAMPDLPTIGEVVPGFAVDGWGGMWAPAGTPREIVLRLNQSLARILKLPEVQERLRAVGAEPAHSTPEEFGLEIAREIAIWSKVVKTADIRIN